MPASTLPIMSSSFLVNHWYLMIGRLMRLRRLFMSTVKYFCFLHAKLTSDPVVVLGKEHEVPFKGWVVRGRTIKKPRRYHV